jgi:hypothetical protein
MTHDKIVEIVRSLKAHMTEEMWIKTAYAFSDALVDGTTHDFPGWWEHFGRGRFLTKCGVPIETVLDVDFYNLPKAVAVWPPVEGTCT